MISTATPAATPAATPTARKEAPALVALLTPVYPPALPAARPPAPCVHDYHCPADGVWICQRCQNTVRRVVQAEPAAPDLPPCAVCGQADRWDDAGIWRCVECETAPSTERLRELARRDGDPGPPDWRVRYPPLVDWGKQSRPVPGCFHVFTTEGRRASCTTCAYTCPIIPDDEVRR